MTIQRQALVIVPYAAAFRDACLNLFDENCPKFFAPNERTHYVDFLENLGALYSVCKVRDDVVGAFGVTFCDEPSWRRLSWIMLSPTSQGAGHGRAMMDDAIAKARDAGANTLEIGASHLSAPFFARFGAREVRYAADGWGPDMHRVDMSLAL